MTEEDIKVAIEELTAHINKTFNISFIAPTVLFFEHRTIAGIANYMSHRVSFNSKLMVQEGFYNTVIHEVAHLTTSILFPDAKQAHGPEFKHVMRTLGGVPNTYHTYDVEPTKRRAVVRHVARCQCQEHLLTTPASKKAWKCKKCNASIALTGEVRKIKP